MSPMMTFLKMGVTALVLSMIEDSELNLDLDLVDPVLEMQAVSRDFGFEHTLQLVDGTDLSAIEIQRRYLAAAQTYLATKGADVMTRQVLDLWESVLDALENDIDSLIGTVDWVSKKSLLDSYRLRDDLGWQDSKLKAIDLQFSDIRADKSLALVIQRNSGVSDFFSEEDIARAVANPPEDTRAYIRGKSVQTYGEYVVGASWESLIFQTSPDDPLQRVGLPDARGYGASETSAFFADHLNLTDFVANLERLIANRH
jgi:proteasome accessory factor A